MAETTNDELMGDEVVTAVCPVCNSAKTHFNRKYPYHSDIFSGCSVMSCDNCGMVFANPMPEDALLHEYNNAYFENAHGGISKNKLTIAFHSAINLTRVLYVEKFKQEKNRTIRSVLEIGPGPGHFARHWLQRNGETTNYTAVDSDLSCYQILADMGINVYDDIAKLPQGNLFDLVVISHVLEHTSHPKGFIESCTRMLSPGGILFIEVPCKDYEHKKFIEPHLLFFDKEPLRQLLANTGFADIRLSYHGNTIRDLKQGESLFQRILNKIKNALLVRGVYFPFSIKETGLEFFSDPLERAVIKPFKAHIEQDAESWWLRALAIKK